MTRSTGAGRGNAPGSRRALAQANEERQRAAAKKAEPTPDVKPTARPHLRAFQSPEQMAQLRRLKAEKRPEAVAARRAKEEAERRTRAEAADAERRAREEAAQAERERLAREAEWHQNRLITILTASRWLGESPVTTLTRVWPDSQLPPVVVADGSTRVRARDVEQVIRADARPPAVYHTPSPRPCGIRDDHSLGVAQWALIFGAAPQWDLVVQRPETRCPQCGRVLEAGWLNQDDTVPYRCSMFMRCDYLAVRRGDEWLRPPGFFGPWSAPAPQQVVDRRVELATFADARAHFADPEADLMPDFEIPQPPGEAELVPIWIAACWLGESMEATLNRIRSDRRSRDRLGAVETKDGRVLIARSEVQRLVEEDAAKGIPHRYRPQPLWSAPNAIKLSRAAQILGERPCAEETFVTWSDACEIFGYTADRLCAKRPPFDYPEPARWR